MRLFLSFDKLVFHRHDLKPWYRETAMPRKKKRLAGSIGCFACGRKQCAQCDLSCQADWGIIDTGINTGAKSAAVTVTP